MNHKRLRYLAWVTGLKSESSRILRSMSLFIFYEGTWIDTLFVPFYVLYKAYLTFLVDTFFWDNALLLLSLMGEIGVIIPPDSSSDGELLNTCESRDFSFAPLRLNPVCVTISGVVAWFKLSVIVWRGLYAEVNTWGSTRLLTSGLRACTRACAIVWFSLLLSLLNGDVCFFEVVTYELIIVFLNDLKSGPSISSLLSWLFSKRGLKLIDLAYLSLTNTFSIVRFVCCILAWMWLAINAKGTAASLV